MTTPQLHPDFRAIIESLTRHGARFLVVGAHALAVAGRARPTDDLDILIQPTAANARAVAEALRDFGFEQLADAARTHLTAVDRMLSIGRPPVQVDILTSISGVSFRAAWRGRVMIEDGDLRIPYLGAGELLLSKRAAGRPKDLRDIATLEEVGVASVPAKPRSPQTRAKKTRAKRAGSSSKPHDARRR